MSCDSHVILTVLYVTVLLYTLELTVASGGSRVGGS